MDCNHAPRMIKRRARAVGLSRDICCRAFRAAGITAYLEGGGRRNHACGGKSVSQQPAIAGGLFVFLLLDLQQRQTADIHAGRERLA